MENEFSKACPESCVMKGGEGPHSYAQNSTFQRSAIEVAKKLLQDAIIINFDLRTTCVFSSISNRICIADLGCSTGPNTFIAVQNMIEAIIKLQYHQSQNPRTTLEFYVFFNDLSSNDFNTLFQKLPPKRNYFAAGVPGSFHGRLFPKQSLHLVHSSASLSWLSKLPEELTDRSCGAWNKGRISYTKAPKEVEDAYKSKFKMDLMAFLEARAQELVGNGLMILMIPAAHDVIDFSVDLYGGKDYELLGSCLMDMVKLGLVSEEKVDTFNVPTYFPHLKDLKKMLESNEDFSVEKMDSFDFNFFIMPNLDSYVSQCRAVLEVLIDKHFGDGVVEELFNRFAEKLLESPELMNFQKLKLLMLFVVLKRKTWA